jgi:hypothetical protein
MDWNAILLNIVSTVGSIVAILGGTTIIGGAFAYIGRNLFQQVLKRDVEKYKHDLRLEADSEKARLESALRKQVEEELLHQRNTFDQQRFEQKNALERQLFEQKNAHDEEMELFRTELTSHTAKSDRIRAEVILWSNPILTSIQMLLRRLENILRDSAFLILSPKTDKAVPGWSARYDYFLPSTVYLFCQYFCWLRLLEQRLSFEMFEKHQVKDAFFDLVRTVGSRLSRFPMDELNALPGGTDDRQIFTLEQHAVGEVVVVDLGGKARCMTYSEFLDNWQNEQFRTKLHPLIVFVNELTPDDVRRWKRLELFMADLQLLREECRRVLDLQA